jgi:lysozyme
MDDYPGLVKMLQLHEGVIPYAYQDSLGYWTIGVGFLIDKKKGGECPPEVIDFWLDHLLTKSRQRLLAALPWVAQLSQVRQDVLLDMVYNLGLEGLLGFHRTLSLVQDGKYSEAAQAMLQSHWAQQVGRRAQHLARLMETGDWEPMPS